MIKRHTVAAVCVLGLLTAAPALAADATAEFVDNAGNVIGSATIIDGPNGLVINFDLQGVEPGFKAVHIHATGDCHDHDHGFMASTGHLNPDGKAHGFLNPDGPDAGDLPNIYAHSDGVIRAQVFSTYASLTANGGRAALLDDDGAALVIHANPDDHFTQPIGGAGPRIACGVVKAAE